MADTGLVIRPAQTADLKRIQEIETAAGELFRTVGMDAIADDPPPTVEELNAYVAAGTAWVATDPAGRVAGYILVEMHGCWAHIEQVTVHPEHGRRGIGAALIAQVDQWAVERGLERLSLTTFRDVPWNAPTTSGSASGISPARSALPGSAVLWSGRTGTGWLCGRGQ